MSQVWSTFTKEDHEGWGMGWRLCLLGFAMCAHVVSHAF